MAISRQSDNIWAMGAMGYGHSHSPARDDDHYKVGTGAHDYGHAMGRKHAQESIDHYNRDERGRFAPMPHHESESEHAAGKISREHRDKFHEGYHKGFTSRIKEHEKEEKDKAEAGGKKISSAIFREAVKVDPVTGTVAMDDPGRFHYKLTHGGSDKGYVPPSWLDKMTGESGKEWKARNPTESNPYRYHTDTLKNIANDERFGLGLGMSEKAPFSPKDVGLDVGDGRSNRKRADLRPGELASKPIQVTDHLGNTHTFVHQITAPNLNTDPENPEGSGPWVVSLHHHISRPDGTAEWLPSEVTEHTDSPRGKSDDLHRDIWGQLHANSDMVTMYGAGAQRVGDKNRSIEYEFPHPQGDVVYRAKLANGWNKHDGYYYDPLLPEKHRERIAPRPQWIVTGKALEREHAHDPKSRTRLVTIEGSEDPRYGDTISYDKDDLPGVIQHVWNGLGVRPDAPAWRRWPQHSIPNTGGLPPSTMIRGHSSVRPWAPEYNIHRSHERLPIQSF